MKVLLSFGVFISIFVSLTLAGDGETVTQIDNNWLDVISKISNEFLDSVVQKGDVSELDYSTVDKQDISSWLTWYEQSDNVTFFAGYIALTGIGLLLLILVTLGGFITCCCRCCGHCGGEPKEREGKSEGCYRGCCGFFFFLFISSVLLGCICLFFMAFAIDDSLRGQSNNATEQLATSIDNIDDYTSTTIDELNSTTIGNYLLLKTNVTTTFDNIASEALDNVTSESGASKALDDLLTTLGTLNNTNTNLLEVILDSVQLQSEMELLQNEIDSTKIATLAILGTCSSTLCDRTKDQLNMLDTANIDFTQYQELKDVITEVTAKLETLTIYITASKIELNKIQETVNDEIEIETDMLNDQMDSIEVEIIKFINDISNAILEYDLSGKANYIRNTTNDISKDGAFNDPYDWTFAIVLALPFLIGLTLLFFFFGVMHGMCVRATPGKESCCTRKAGSGCLLAGLTILFICFWAWMLATLVMFLIGGVSHTVVCREVLQPNKSEFTDDIFKEIFANDTSLNISRIYSMCSNNDSLYQTFGYMIDMDIDELLDTSPIDEAFDDVKSAITLLHIGDVTILTDEITAELSAIGVIIQNMDTRLTILVESLPANVTTISIGDLVTNLTELAVDEPTIDLADTIVTFQLLATNSTNLNAQIDPMKSALEAASIDLGTIRTAESLAELEKSQNSLNTDGNMFIQDFTTDKVNELEHHVNVTITSIDTAVKYDIGKCAPLYYNYNLAVESVCVTLLYPINSFWFCMYCCLLLLIPCIFMAFKLVTYYRRTKPYKAPPKNQVISAYDEASSDSRTQLVPLPRVRYTVEEGQPPGASPRHANVMENPSYDGYTHYPTQYEPVRYVTRPQKPQNHGGIMVYPEHSERPPAYNSVDRGHI